MKEHFPKLARRIRERYNADHDMGPDAPVPWYVVDLLEIIELQQDQIDRLLAAIPQASTKESKP